MVLRLPMFRSRTRRRVRRSALNSKASFEVLTVYSVSLFLVAGWLVRNWDQWQNIISRGGCCCGWLVAPKGGLCCQSVTRCQLPATSQRCQICERACEPPGLSRLTYELHPRLVFRDTTTFHNWSLGSILVYSSTIQSTELYIFLRSIYYYLIWSVI